MKKMIIGFAAVVGFTMASSLALAGGDAAAGQTKTALCAGCPGADGNSAMATFPKLAGQGEKYLTKQLNDIKSGARTVPEMTGMLTNFSEQDLADIAAYYASKTIQMAGAKEENLDRGESLFRGGNPETGVPACTGCHSPAGNGNAPAGYPAIGGQFAQYTAKQLRAFRTGAHDPENDTARTNDGDTRVMRGVAAHMSDVEIEAVSNFIAGLK
jgi:cytochrome c553